MSDTPVINLDAVTRRFGRISAVEQLSISVGQGQVMGLLGPTGAGKSVTMQLTAGLLRPTSGTVQVAGIDAIRRSAALRKKIGYVPQQLGTHPRSTVAELLDFVGRAYGLGRRDRGQRINDVLSLVDALDQAQVQVDQLSLSQRRRMEIARALIHDPDVLLLDDPIGGLYDATRLALCGLMRRLADGGKTVMVTARSYVRLIDIADSFAILIDGRLQTFGEAQNVIRQFVTQRTYELQLIGGASADAAARIITEQLGEHASVATNHSMIRFSASCSEVQLAQITAALAAAQLGVVRLAEIEQELAAATREPSNAARVDRDEHHAPTPDEDAAP